MIRAITVCVNYDDLLAVTLPTWLPHVSEVLVITAIADKRTQELCAKYPQVRVHVTDAFYTEGATFRKGLAMEEGFDILGRTGWILIIDSDIVLPANMPLPTLHPGKLYSPHRRILRNPQLYSTELNWDTLPGCTDREHAGYFQLFHAADPVLHGVRPWYGTGWTHCGGCDSVFERRWAKINKVRPDFTVLHLGPDGTNWHGRVTERIDIPLAVQP